MGSGSNKTKVTLVQERGKATAKQQLNPKEAYGSLWYPKEPYVFEELHCKTALQKYPSPSIQWRAIQTALLANYYVNEVTLRGQKPPLKSC